MASPHLLELTDDNFEQEVYGSEQPVLVDFWAEWCPPCRAVAPIIDELADHYAGRVKVAKVDVDAHQQVAGKLGISSIPTIILFQGEEILEKFIGVKSKAEFIEALDRVAV